MLSLFHRQYGKLPDCSGARRRNNHCQSKFICFVITVHFREVVRHLRSEMFSYTLITAALWPFVCLLKNLFPICMEIFRRPMHIQECPNKKKEIQKEKVTLTSIVSVIKTLACCLIPCVYKGTWYGPKCFCAQCQTTFENQIANLVSMRLVRELACFKI